MIKSKYVQAERSPSGRLVAKGTLKKGFKIGETFHREFEMQSAITGDLLAAERVATTDTALNFNAALMARQLQKVGTFEGPFTLELLGKLETYDFNTLREAQAELDLLGEAD